MDYKLFLKRNLPKTFVNKIKKIRYAKKTKYIDVNSEKEFQVIKELVNSGDKVIDIGAALGLYTKYLSDLVGHDGRVYSFEPISSTFEILEYIVNTRKMSNVVLMNCAVSNIIGKVTMEIPPYEDNEENFYEAKIINGTKLTKNRIVEVKTSTLDSIFTADEFISFIKIDVEGHEFESLLGAISFLKRNQPSLLIEIWGNLNEEGSRAFQTYTYLVGLGYSAYVFDGEKLKLRKRDEVSINYFFLKEDHIKQLQKTNIIL